MLDVGSNLFLLTKLFERESFPSKFVLMLNVAETTKYVPFEFNARL